MNFTLFEITKYDEQWWIGVFGVVLDCFDFDAHLFYIERDMGKWKLDFLWLRPFWIKYKEE